MEYRKIILVSAVCFIIVASVLYYFNFNESVKTEDKKGILETNEEIPLSDGTVELPVHPQVVISHEELDHDLVNLTHTEVWQAFSTNYTMEDCTIEFRDTIIKEMMAQAEEQEEDPDILLACIYATYQNWSSQPRAVPSYAERGSYMGCEVWGIAFNRANGPDEYLHHTDIYYVNIEEIQSANSISCYSGCNSTCILAQEHCR